MDREELREAAVGLRRAGRTRRQIAEELGIHYNRDLSHLLANEPPQEWTRRPRAKDADRERARELRGQGRTYDEIAAELKVSKSSVSLWTRDVPIIHRARRLSDHGRMMANARWEEHRRQSETERVQTKLAAARQIGELSDRELFLMGVALYWAEGSKDKPWARSERATFVNSDAHVIEVYLRWLTLVGVDASRLRFRVSIHETADAEAAVRYWAEIVGVDPQAFQRTTVKQHTPKTTRKNVGDGYHGCLSVVVLGSAKLYQAIEGWWLGAVTAATRHGGGTAETRNLDAPFPGWSVGRARPTLNRN